MVNDLYWYLMSEEADRLASLLIPFGLSQDEAVIYLLLLKNFPLSALEISRKIEFARTKVYRLLDKLIAQRLVRQKLDARGLKFEAVSHTQLENILIQKEQEVDVLRETLSHLVKQLETVAAEGRTKSKVLYYTGIDGLKQVQWNSLRAHGELLIYEIKNMAAFLPQEYCEEVRRELVERQIYVRELTNQAKVADWTEVKELVLKYWQVRYVPPEKLQMKFEVMIYNDIYTMYSYREGEIFCVEIYNRNLSEMQKQLFEFVWHHATPMKIVNERGWPQ